MPQRRYLVLVTTVSPAPGTAPDAEQVLNKPGLNSKCKRTNQSGMHTYPLKNKPLFVSEPQNLLLNNER